MCRVARVRERRKEVSRWMREENWRRGRGGRKDSREAICRKLSVRRVALSIGQSRVRGERARGSQASDSRRKPKAPSYLLPGRAGGGEEEGWEGARRRLRHGETRSVDEYIRRVVGKFAGDFARRNRARSARRTSYLYNRRGTDDWIEIYYF